MATHGLRRIPAARILSKDGTGLDVVNAAESRGVRMPTLQQQIAEKFLKQLAQSTEVSAEKVERLRSVLSAAKKPKADDFVRVFTEPDHGDIK